METAALEQTLKKYWGHEGFRAGQLDIILSVLNKKDTIALLPTGGGKSVCFQVPALHSEGACIVISPLIALMHDQVQHLKAKGIKASYIHSGIHFSDIDRILTKAIEGKIKFLYISPERVQSKNFQEAFSRMKVNLVAIDEAHCISQWGYDFRPDYRKIPELRKLNPSVPFIALTATATPKVVDDIARYLTLKNPQKFAQSFERKNLSFYVIETENKNRKLLQSIQKIKGCGIVYAKNRKTTKILAEFLSLQNIKATFYHGGMEATDRMVAQEKWLDNSVQVMVSTNAFGMGIDKPDVRFVIHYDIPESPEAYYQEAGRAGRDGKESICLLLYHEHDKIKMAELQKLSSPPVPEIKKTMQLIYSHLNIPHGAGYLAHFPFYLETFCAKFDLKAFHVFNCMKQLERQGLLVMDNGIKNSSKLQITASLKEIEDFQAYAPDLSLLINTLIRSYPNIFSQNVYIQEIQIAKRINVSVDKLKGMLERLKTQKLITYTAENIHNGITLTRPRENEISLNEKEYNEWRENMKQKMEAMIDFAENKTVCKSKLLMRYFGERMTTDCGKCSTCREKEISKTIRKKIIENLPQHAEIPSLVSHLGLAYQPLILSQIREMIDENIIVEKDKKIYLA